MKFRCYYRCQNSAELKSEHNQLVEGCKKGKREAQMQLYQQYSKAMYNICMRLLNSREEAEDLLQDTFMDVFKNIKRFEYNSTVGAWIKRITINNCINHLKKKRPDIASIEDYEFKDNEPSTVVNETEMRYNVEQVNKGISALPDGYRVVLSLYLLEGYDHSEISEILNISVGTSKSQFNRAKNKLKSILNNSGDYGEQRQTI